jgi:hypothetical protein
MAIELKLGEVFAQALIGELQLGPFPDVEAVARHLRLLIKERPLSGCDGLLIRPVGIVRGLVAINAKMRSIERKRFTLAHEIGHYVLPGHEGSSAACAPADIEGWGRGSREGEKQADEFAAELLIPEEYLRLTVGGARPSLELLSRIASDRKTSLSAAGWKFCDFTSERCALVWSRYGRIEWTKPSKEFQHFLRRKDLLDDRSLAAESFRSRKQIFPDHILAAVWLESENLIDHATIYEDSRWLPSYESVITLLTIPKRIELRTEFGDEDEEPLDPTDFTVHRRRWPR